MHQPAGCPPSTRRASPRRAARSGARSAPAADRAAAPRRGPWPADLELPSSPAPATRRSPPRATPGSWPRRAAGAGRSLGGLDQRQQVLATLEQQLHLVRGVDIIELGVLVRARAQDADPLALH